jgi:hypothetical protein
MVRRNAACAEKRICTVWQIDTNDDAPRFQKQEGEMNRSALTFTCLSLAVLFWAISAASAQAGTHTRLLIPLAGFVISNDCNGESVTLSGQLQVNITLTEDRRGGTHSVIAFNVQGVKGQGDLGNTYSLSDSGVTSSQTTNGAAVFSSPEHATAISHGAAPNFYVEILVRFTVNANGDITAAITNLDTACRG